MLAFFALLRRSSGPASAKALSIHHDDTFVGRESSERMGDTGYSKHREFVSMLHSTALVGDRAARLRHRQKAGARRLAAASQPTNRLSRPGALGIEIGDHRDLKARDRRRLRQKHRAEFAGAINPTRPACRPRRARRAGIAGSCRSSRSRLSSSSSPRSGRTVVTGGMVQDQTARCLLDHPPARMMTTTCYSAATRCVRA